MLLDESTKYGHSIVWAIDFDDWGCYIRKKVLGRLKLSIYCISATLYIKHTLKSSCHFTNYMYLTFLISLVAY